MLLRGSYWGGEHRLTSPGGAVTDTFFVTAREAGRMVNRCEWTFMGNAPDAGVNTTWATVDGCAETASVLQDKHRVAVEMNGYASTWFDDVAEELRMVVAAAEQVRRGIPWWAAVRTVDGWQRLPRWSKS